MQKQEEVREVTLEELFADWLFETDEERKDRLQEEYAISSKKDIDKLLSSTLSYSEKLEILRKEKERVSFLSEQMEEAEYKFKNTRVFINKMLDACDEIKDRMKMDIPLTIGGITISSFTFHQLVTFLEQNRFTDLSFDQFGGFLFGGVFAPIVSLIYAYYIAKDVCTLSDYKKQIKSYNRKLKRNKRQ